MERNRYFKSTFGVGAEFVLANSLDNSGTPVDGLAPTPGTSSVTVAASPALGDRINITVNGGTYTYLVKSTDTTAATLVASIVAYINATNNGAFVASVTGTTSAVFSFAAPLGTSFNGATVTSTLGSPNVSTFSANTSTNFGTNGVDPVSGGAQGTFALFRANAANGALGVYWVDTNQAVLPGTTGLYANVNREFFYAWKTMDGNTMVTTGIKAGTRSYRQAPYNAGTVDQYTVTVTGTLTLGQTVRIRIIDVTSVQVPYPNWSYEVFSTGTIATDLLALRDLINAETQDAVATATASGAILTINGIYNSRQLKVNYSVDTFGSATPQNIDQSVVAIAQVTTSQSEVGTTADVLEYEKYFKVQNGVMIYTREGVLPSEFSSISQQTQVGIQYGFLVVTDQKESIHQSNVLALKSKRYTIVALPSTSLAQLASY